MILHSLEIAAQKFLTNAVSDYETPLNADGTLSRYGFR